MDGKEDDFSMISVEELEADLVETEEDIQVCLAAMSMGIDIYGEGSSVADRYEDNKLIRAKILRELKRRGHTKEAECHTSQS